MNEQMLRDHEECKNMCGIKCISWSGTVAGALIAVGLSFILSLFGAAIGLSAFHTSPEGVMTLSIGGYVGMLIGIIAIMYFAGWVAGYSGHTHHCFSRHLGAVKGLTAWCLALVITVLIATQSMQFISANLYSMTNYKVMNVSLFNDNGTPMVNMPATTSTKNMAMQTNVNDEATMKMLKQAMFLTFGLFFVGAISSAIGGHCGLRRKAVDCALNRTDSNKL